MVVMMDVEISCKGHYEKLSHFLDHVSHTATAKYSLQQKCLPVNRPKELRINTCGRSR